MLRLHPFTPKRVNGWYAVTLAAFLFYTIRKAGRLGRVERKKCRAEVCRAYFPFRLNPISVRGCSSFSMNLLR